MTRSINEARQKIGKIGKDKKNGHLILIPLLLGSTLVPLAFGALALLAGKALIVSKLALALASIIGIKKLISHGHHHETAHEGISKIFFNLLKIIFSLSQLSLADILVDGAELVKLTI